MYGSKKWGPCTFLTPPLPESGGSGPHRIVILWGSCQKDRENRYVFSAAQNDENNTPDLKTNYADNFETSVFNWLVRSKCLFEKSL